MRAHRRTLILVGPPNAGKTTLFNWLTGSKARAVNYPGSTVDYRRGLLLESVMPKGALPLTWEVIDTPGIYGISPKSLDEEVTLALLRDAKREETTVIAVCDATHLSRHLVLTRQIQELGFETVFAITMSDLLKKSGSELDLEKLQELLGAPATLIDGRLGGGVPQLVQALSHQEDIHSGLTETKTAKPARDSKTSPTKTIPERMSEARQLTAQVLREKPIQARKLTRKIDQWALHPVGGPLIFFALMTTFFSAIFWLAQPLMDSIDEFFSWAVVMVHNSAGEGLVYSFLADGVLASIGGVAVFIPQIFILFVGLTLLEDSGYLARASSLADRPLSALGMNGRAFTPLMSGFACAIPAMMAVRSISNKRERLLTLAILPLMSCSARLPVYTLLLTYLMHDKPVWWAGLSLTVLYVASILLGAVASLVLSRMIPKTKGSFFALELPLYRRPRFRNVFLLAFQKTKSFATRAGPVIFVLAVVVWALTTFPHYELQDDSARVEQSYAGQLGHVIEPVLRPMGADWRIGVGLISAFAAREVFVSALAVVFHATAPEDEGINDSLLGAMRTATFPDGTALFVTSTVVGLLVFFLIALQCLSTVGMSLRESGSYKFALLQLVVFNVGAYCLAVLVVQGLRVVGIA